MRNAAILLSLALLAAPALADREVSRAVVVKTPRGKVQRVVIDIPAGGFRIRNSADNSIAVDGVMSHNYDGRRSRERAEEILDDTAVEIIVHGDEATIRRRLGSKADGWRGDFTTFELRVEVPDGADLEIGTHFGEVRMDGTFGNVEADLRAGEIHFRAPRNSVGQLSASCRLGEVHADLGDRILDREGVFPGRTYFVNANGKGRVKLHVTAGEVHVKLTQ